MSVIPFGIAWYLAKHPGTVRLGTNHGELISPPLATEAGEFSGADAFRGKHRRVERALDLGQSGSRPMRRNMPRGAV